MYFSFKHHCQTVQVVSIKVSKPVGHLGKPTMVAQRKTFLRCSCSKTASALILSLFLRVKILYLAHRKFTFLLFRSNSCLFSYFNDVALAIIKLQKHRRMVVITLWATRTKLVSRTSMLGKAAWGQVWTRK